MSRESHFFVKFFRTIYFSDEDIKQIIRIYQFNYEEIGDPIFLNSGAEKQYFDFKKHLEKHKPFYKKLENDVEIEPQTLKEESDYLSDLRKENLQVIDYYTSLLDSKFKQVEQKMKRSKKEILDLNSKNAVLLRKKLERFVDKKLEDKNLDKKIKKT